MASPTAPANGASRVTSALISGNTVLREWPNLRLSRTEFETRVCIQSGHARRTSTQNDRRRSTRGDTRTPAAIQARQTIKSDHIFGSVPY